MSCDIYELSPLSSTQFDLMDLSRYWVTLNIKTVDARSNLYVVCVCANRPEEDSEEESVAHGGRQNHDNLYRVHMPSLYSCGSSYGSETSIPAGAHTVSNAPVTEYMWVTHTHNINNPCTVFEHIQVTFTLLWRIQWGVCRNSSITLNNVSYWSPHFYSIAFWFFHVPPFIYMWEK